MRQKKFATKGFFTRHKIGLLVPAGNTTIEPDFMSIVPQNVSFHSTRIYSKTKVKFETQENVDEINNNINEFVNIILNTKPEIIVYGFTAGSFYRGTEFAYLFKNQIEKQSKVPTILPSLAILEALEFLKAEKISVITPYLEWNYIVLKQFLDKTKYKILNIKWDDRPQDISINDRLTRQEPENIIKYILENYDKNADTILLPCTAWRTFEIVNIIEKETKLKVITANQATICSVFKSLKIEPKDKNVGILFKETNFK